MQRYGIYIYKHQGCLDPFSSESLIHGDIFVCNLLAKYVMDDMILFENVWTVVHTSMQTSVTPWAGYYRVSLFGYI